MGSQPCSRVTGCCPPIFCLSHHLGSCSPALWFSQRTAIPQIGTRGPLSRDGQSRELFPFPGRGQAGQPPASGRLGRVPALASGLRGPDILPVPPPALSTENRLFVGSGLDGQLTWPGRSSWREPRGDGCGGSRLGRPGV